MIEGIYIHIPFCEQICVYCDFHKEVALPSKKANYIHRLIQSLKTTSQDLSSVKTIYIGGGTPSTIEKELLETLLIQIKKTFDLNNVVEYTIEANPNDITKEKALLFKRNGINRVSLGVQSFDDDILKRMNRSHQAKDINQALHYLNQVGLTNISIDLIFGFDTQTLKQVEHDLQKAMTLGINHISYYALILEEKSIMHYLINQGKMRIVDEDLDYLMYNKIIDTLIKNNYQHYEISNFAKKGYQSIHNMLYWTQKEYLGFGSGAHSFAGQQRFYIKPNVSDYIASTIDQDCTMYYPSYELEDALLFGLRVLQGINVQAFEKKYTVKLFTRYPVLETFIAQEMLIIKEGYLRFTSKGLMLANNVFTAILEDHHA